MKEVSRREVLRWGAMGAAVPAVLAATARTAPTAHADTGPASPASSPTGAVPEQPTPMPSTWVVKPFENNQVVLSESLFTHNRDLNDQFLLNYPIDNILFLFQENAGLPTAPGAHQIGAWDAEGGNLRGHYTGHFLSGLALAYAGTGNRAFHDRLSYLVAGLGDCQDALSARVGMPAEPAPVTWSAGQFGNAISLNGTSTYVELPENIVESLTDFTIATWVNPDRLRSWSRVFDFGSSTRRNMFVTLSPNGSGRPRFSITRDGSGGEQQVNSSETVSANNWLHVAVTLAGSTATMYLNGVAVGSNDEISLTPSDLGSTDNNWIGRSQYGDPLFSGLVDDFQIYDRALTADEIAALGQSVDGGLGGGNVAWYQFDQSSGNAAPDSSGNHRDATVFAGVGTPAGPSHAGFLAAYPETQFIELESFARYPTIWAPWYTNHMIMRGLLDAYQYAGIDQALDVATGMGDWAWSRLQNCTREQLDQMWRIYIAGEYNAMPVALTDLYAWTGNEDYLKAAQCFVNTYLFDDAVANNDTIDGEHANQHIPQYWGYLCMYERFTDSVQPVYRGPAEQYLTAAENFWDMVVPHRIYVDGGMAGSGEIFGARDVIASTIQGSNAESCCEYNMLKLSRSLFFNTADPKYMQYYERALFGQILQSRRDQPSDTNPNVTYFIPVNPGARRSYGNLGTCCGGTGIESHGKYQDSIYFSSLDDSTLYVNLYIPSTLNWAARGISVTLSTVYPTDPAGVSTLTVNGSGSFTMKLRVPYWVEKGYTVLINGVRQRLTATPGEYVAINRTWSNGDTVEVRAPFTLRVERALDQPQTQAFAYGPVTMITQSGERDYLDYTLYSGLGLSGDVSQALTETAPMMFQNAAGDTVRPFYINDTERYHVYFHRQEPSIVFGSVDSGVPNPARPDGLTFLDAVWDSAPFDNHGDFVRAVQQTAQAFSSAGLLSRAQSHVVLAAAARARLPR